VRIFKTRWFDRFTRAERIDRARLVEAIERAECGMIDADLGGHLVKQRVARSGQGRSGGYRTVIAIQTGSRSFFLHGFAKNEKSNLDDQEVRDLKKLAARLLALTDDALARALNEGELVEI
jgi:hypothetical protein